MKVLRQKSHSRWGYSTLEGTITDVLHQDDQWYCKGKKNKEFNLKKTTTTKKKRKRKARTHAMLSGSVAQAPTALVTFTKRAWFVLVSRFTSEGMPPALRMVVLLAGIWAHSPKAPTTLIKTCAWKIKFMPSTRGKKYPQRTKKVNVCLSVGKRPERHIH